MELAVNNEPLYCRRRADTDSEKSSSPETSVDSSSKSHINEVPCDGDGIDKTGAQPSSSNNSRKVPTVKILPQAKPSSVSSFGEAEKNVNKLCTFGTTEKNVNGLSTFGTTEKNLNALSTFGTAEKNVNELSASDATEKNVNELSTFGATEKNVNELQKVVSSSEPTSVIAYAAAAKCAGDQPHPKSSSGQEGEDVVIVEKVIKHTDGVKGNFSAPDGSSSASVKVDEPLLIVLTDPPGKKAEDSPLQKIQTLEKQLEEKIKYLSSCQERMKRDELQLENALYCLKKLREQNQEKSQIQLPSAKPAAETALSTSNAPSIVASPPSESSQPRLVLNARERSELLITGPIPPKASVELASQQKQQPLRTESPQQQKISVHPPQAHPSGRAPVPVPSNPASNNTLLNTLGPLDWRLQNLLAGRSELQAFPVKLKPDHDHSYSTSTMWQFRGAAPARKPETTVRVSLGSRGGSRNYPPVVTTRATVPNEIKTTVQPSQTQQVKPPMAIRGGGRGRAGRGNGFTRERGRTASGARQPTASTQTVDTTTKDLPADVVPTEFNCGACGTIFYDGKDMETHECVGHVAVTHTKTVGSVIANLTESAFRSVNSKTGNVLLKTSSPKQFSCASCSLDFDTEFNLESHNDFVHRIHTLQTFTCDICGKIYTQKSGLMVHRRTHKVQERQRSQPDVQEGVRNFVCAICDAAFCTNTALEKHKRGHETTIAAPRRFQCFTCKQGFDSAIALDEHILNHERFEKLLNQFTKNDSGKTTKSSDPDIEILDVLPPKSSSSSGNSVSTTQNPKPEQSPVLCYICSKSFKSLEEVNKHVVSHIDESLEEQRAQIKETHQFVATTTNGNETLCSMCSKVFRDQNSLEIHVKAEHSKKTIFPCQICGIGFPYEKALSLHCALIHAKNNSKP